MTRAAERERRVGRPRRREQRERAERRRQTRPSRSCPRPPACAAPRRGRPRRRARASTAQRTARPTGRLSGRMLPTASAVQTTRPASEHLDRALELPAEPRVDRRPLAVRGVDQSLRDAHAQEQPVDLGAVDADRRARRVVAQARDLRIPSPRRSIASIRPAAARRSRARARPGSRRAVEQALELLQVAERAQARVVERPDGGEHRPHALDSASSARLERSHRPIADEQSGDDDDERPPRRRARRGSRSALDRVSSRSSAR